MFRIFYAVVLLLVFPVVVDAKVYISEVAWPRRPSRAWRRGKMGLLIGLSICVMPSITHASVVISEVAWMGSGDNANAEWIELYNDGAMEDLSDWTLHAVDGQPAIALSGTMAENSYALLERTSDDIVPNVPAFLVYTGALGNTGEVLELRNSAGTLIDRVDGSDDWAIGGNNDTKETLQRSGTPATGGWVTALPTPRGEVSVVVEVEEADEPETTAVSSGGGSVLLPNTSLKENTAPRREPGLILELGSERTVTVGVTTDFMASTYRESGKEVVVQDVVWNFGDGAVGQGKTVTHVFQYAGTYVVTAHACRTGFLKEICDDDRVVVTAVTPSVEIVTVTSDYVEVKNTSSKELELSGFVLSDGAEHFRIPQGTILLSQASIKFPSTVTALKTQTSSEVIAYHPSGVLATRHVAVPAVKATPPPIAYIPKQTTVSVPVQKIVPPVVTEADTDTDVASVALPEFTKVAQAFGTVPENADTKEGNTWWWLLGVLATVLIVVLSAIFIRAEQTEIIEGLEIESDE